MNDFIIGLIRTWVPIGVGFVLSWLITQGILPEEDYQTLGQQATGVLTAVLAGAYYWLVRLLAKVWPWTGVLLGYNVKPKYNDPSAATSYNAFGKEAA